MDGNIIWASTDRQLDNKVITSWTTHSARRPQTLSGRPSLGHYKSFPDVLIRRGPRKKLHRRRVRDWRTNYALRTPGRDRTSEKLDLQQPTLQDVEQNVEDVLFKAFRMIPFLRGRRNDVVIASPQGWTYEDSKSISGRTKYVYLITYDLNRYVLLTLRRKATWYMRALYRIGIYIPCYRIFPEYYFSIHWYIQRIECTVY